LLPAFFHPELRKGLAHPHLGRDLGGSGRRRHAGLDLGGRCRNDGREAVPLSRPVMTILSPAHEMRFGDYVFPGRTRGKPMSNMAMLELLKDLGRTGITVHGFRATFRTWADEERDFSNQAVEFCLAHVPGDESVAL
jgi:integrase